jgi:hypothetical protein
MLQNVASERGRWDETVGGEGGYGHKYWKHLLPPIGVMNHPTKTTILSCHAREISFIQSLC